MSIQPTLLQLNMLEMVLKAQGAVSAVCWHTNLSFLEGTIQSNPSFVPNTANYRLNKETLTPVMG